MTIISRCFEMLGCPKSHFYVCKPGYTDAKIIYLPLSNDSEERAQFLECVAATCEQRLL